MISSASWVHFTRVQRWAPSPAVGQGLPGIRRSMQPLRAAAGEKPVSQEGLGDGSLGERLPKAAISAYSEEESLLKQLRSVVEASARWASRGRCLKLQHAQHDTPACSSSLMLARAELCASLQQDQTSRGLLFNLDAFSLLALVPYSYAGPVPRPLWPPRPSHQAHSRVLMPMAAAATAGQQPRPCKPSAAASWSVCGWRQVGLCWHA